jgi:hypothetical protein
MTMAKESHTYKTGRVKILASQTPRVVMAALRF